MKLIKIVTKYGKFFFNKDLIEWKNGLKTKTNFNVSSFLINNEYVAISTDKITFICECGKEETCLVSNFKNKKHDLCISCTRKKTISDVHRKMNADSRIELNNKISKKTKEAMSKISPEKRKEMTKKMFNATDWESKNKKWYETMSSKTDKEKKDIYKKISETLKNKTKPWNLHKNTNSLKDKLIPENRWYTRGAQSSNEILDCKCDDCGKIYSFKRAALAKQENLHPGLIYCKYCKVNGNRNPSYIDGRKYNVDNSYTPKFYSNDFRKYLIEKQNYICPICNKEIYKSGHLHHIDYNKKNDMESNLIFLHNSCHSKTNYNRERWIDFFNKKGESEDSPLLNS